MQTQWWERQVTCSIHWVNKRTVRGVSQRHVPCVAIFFLWQDVNGLFGCWEKQRKRRRKHITIIEIKFELYMQDSQISYSILLMLDCYAALWDDVAAMHLSGVACQRNSSVGVWLSTLKLRLVT